ncbi:hypothetical protein CEXT_293141 [Caerostris extrusa]|uniref:Uncharacterized protein n=1 Tax=Caerostris extrusa TaxID=172846 RepID=A0AAV4SZD1_CAEEX|nr:hypothetical protein CEXT_293141 [Caerostris extrusa]
MKISTTKSESTGENKKKIPFQRKTVFPPRRIRKYPSLPPALTIAGTFQNLRKTSQQSRREGNQTESEFKLPFPSTVKITTTKSESTGENEENSFSEGNNIPSEKNLKIPSLPPALTNAGTFQNLRKTSQQSRRKTIQTANNYLLNATSN